MPTFSYRAVARGGQIVKNRVEEQSKASLIKKLKKNGLIPITVVQLKYKRLDKAKVKRKNINISNELKNIDVRKTARKREESLIERAQNALARTTKITDRDISVFTQNFYLLKKANFNNIHALSTVIETIENIQLKEVLEDVLAGVEAGETMHTTMEYYPDVFPYIYINMIKVGELSGSLTNSLGQAVKYLDDTVAIRKKLRSILIPNIIQFVALIVMLFAGTLFAIPVIQNLFTEMGSTETLPAVTLWFSGVVNTLVEIWYIPLLIVILIAVAIISYVRTPKGKYNFHYFKYTMPVFGRLIYLLDLSRFLKAVLLNLQNGMRVQEAIEVSKNVISNYVMLSIIEISKNNILIGKSWIEPFEQANFPAPMAIEMLKIGMQTDLSEMMEKIIEYLDVDINNTMESVIKALPQVVYSIVGVVMIFFVVVVLVPVIQVYMGNFLFSAAGL